MDQAYSRALKACTGPTLEYIYQKCKLNVYANVSAIKTAC